MISWVYTDVACRNQACYSWGLMIFYNAEVLHYTIILCLITKKTVKGGMPSLSCSQALCFTHLISTLVYYKAFYVI